MVRDTLLRTGLAALALVLLPLIAGCAGTPASRAQAHRGDALFQQVRLGMSREDVRRLLGPPDPAGPFGLSDVGSWDYHYQDTWGYIAVFSVSFDAGGRAVGKLAWRVNDGGDHQ